MGRMDLTEAMRTALARPTPDALWRVRQALLTSGLETDHPIHELLREFQAFLVAWQSTVAAEHHSENASRLDLAAFAGLAFEELSTAGSPAEVASRVLGGLASESLAFAATRQHVRAWRGELNALLTGVAWTLGGLLWTWSSRRRPDLPAEERGRLVDQLTSGVRTPKGEADARAMLAIRLYQVMLLDESAALAISSGGNEKIEKQ